MQLFISTATNNVLISLYQKNTIIKEDNYVGDNNHVITFYEKIEKYRPYFDGINKIIVVNGPGSFTGLRIGVIFASTIAMEMNIDLETVNLVEVLELDLKQKIAIDARGGKSIILKEKKLVKVQNEDLCTDFVLDPYFKNENLFMIESISKKSSWQEIQVIYASEL